MDESQVAPALFFFFRHHFPRLTTMLLLFKISSKMSDLIRCLALEIH